MADGVSFSTLAKQYGTPLYVYSAGLIKENFRRVVEAFKDVDHMVAYSVKSNSNLAILQMLKDEGSCFDIVSGGELARVQKAGIDCSKVIFAGVGKTSEEIRAAINAGVGEFNVESEPEAYRINEVAAFMGKVAPIAIRINPNVDAKTHKYITTGKTENKFGISLERALKLGKEVVSSMPNLRIEGLHCHIGSQILDSSVHPQVVDIVIDYAKNFMSETGAKLRTLNFGGGFGIAYEEGQKPLDIKPFAGTLAPRIKELGVTLVLEPGRSISGPAGVLLTSVEYVKVGDTRKFIIIDAAMTELMRPALYEAHHRILPIKQSHATNERLDFVGPVCETGDFIALNREAPAPEQGDLLAIMDAGAYGFVMASNYNSRPKPAEILVENGEANLIRERETIAGLFESEKLLS